MPSSENDKTRNLLETIHQQKEQIQDFERLNSVLENVCSSMQVEETLRRIIEGSIELCDADQASILLIGRKSQEAVTIVREGSISQEKGSHYLNKLLAGWVSKRKTSLLTHDLIKTFGEENIKPKYADISSVLCVPLMLKGKTIGIIILISRSDERKFDDRDLLLLNILASPCAQFIQNAHLHEELFAETVRLKKEIENKYALHGIIGNSPKMRSLYSILERITPTDVQVLLQGESGTGKERIAQTIHYSGLRKDGPFVAVDCGALPANLLESQLFGYVKGAFTGANQDRKGLFEEAHGGTLFLDEIVNMSLEVQGKFLRAIQESEIRPLGTTEMRKVDVRIISAASQSLKELVEKGNFRQDLYYRLNVVNLFLPPLRERREDIAMLANHFLDNMNEKYGKQIKGFKNETISSLESYHWPGNIRELEYAIERAVVLCKSDWLNEKDFPLLKAQPLVTDKLFTPRALQDAINDFKKSYISQILDQTGGNQTKAAEILKIQRAYLNQMIKKLSVK